MATTINSGYGNSPKLTANIADHADVYGGRALVFDGVADYLQLPEPILTTNHSISFWIYTTNTSSGMMPFSEEDAQNDGVYIFLVSNQIYYRVNSTQKIESFSYGSKWTHICCTYDGSTMNIYADGEALGNGVSNSTTLNVTTAGRIGKRAINNQYYFDGKMCDFKIFDTALTEAQVQELYKKPENTPSAVQDNLIAWYPMIEGNPESPQSIVYDHSEKGLSSEKFGFASDDWNNFGSSNISQSGGTISYTGSGIGNASVRYDGTTYGAFTFETDKLYKIVFTVSTATQARFKMQTSGSVIFLSSTTYSSGTYTRYIKALSSYNGSGFVLRGETSGDNFDITSISLKEVLMGNHATTNFFGDENITSNVASDWTPYANAQIGNGSSTGEIYITAGSDTRGAYRSVTGLTNGNTYKLTLDAYYSGTSDQIRVGVWNGSADTFTDYVNAGSYTTLTLTYTQVSGTILLANGINQGNNLFIKNLSLKEIGISSSGFETAVNEPVVPQVPLMRYNQKAIFDRNKNTYVSLTEQTLEANTAFTIAFSFTPFNNGEHHMIGKNSTDDTIRVDTTGAHRIAIRINNDFGSMTGTGNVNANESHFCVITRTTGGAFSVYRNGVKSTASFTNTSDFKYQYLGQSLNGGWESDGLLDEFSIFNTHFSDAEAQELFNDGVALDATTHSKKGNLIGYWRNDGVTTWQDRRGWSFLDFDGSSDEVTLDSELTFTGVFSVSFWVKHNSSGVEYVLGKVGGDQDYFYAHPTHPRWRINDNIISSDSDMAVGVWHHVLGVRDSSDNFIWYLNGSLATLYNGSSYVTTGVTRSGDFDVQYFGRSLNSYGEIELTNVAFFNTDKSSSASTFYNNGLSYDYSTESGITNYYKMDSSSTLLDRVGSVNGTVDATLNDGNDGTVSGSPDSITIREGLNSNRDGLGFYFTNPSSNVLRLNGVDEYVDIGNPKTLQFQSAFTIGCWVKTYGALSGYVRIISKDDGTNRSYILHSNNGKPVLFIFKNGGSASSNESTVDIDDGNWHYVVGVHDGTNLSIFQSNGTTMTQTATSTNGGVIDNDSANVEIGRFASGSGSEFFKGLIDEVTMYNKALSLTEIIKNYKHGKGKHKND